MPTIPTNDELEAARERARLAMEGDTRREKETVENKALAEKRLLARLAMEGPERKKRREEREKETKDKETMRLRIDDEVKRRVEEAAKKKQAEEKEIKDREAAKEQELKQKENIFIQSKGVIEQLKKEKGSSLRPLRTLQTDLAGAVRTEKLSETKIAIAEQERGPKTYAIPQTSSGGLKKIAISFIVLIFLIAGSAGGYWYWLNRTGPGSNNPALVVQSIIYAETSKEIDTDKLSGAGLTTEVNGLLNTPATTGETISNIYFTKEVLTSDGKTKTKSLLNFSEWLKYSQSAIPEDFSRFVKNYMIGVYRGANKNSLFIALKVDLFENVYQELLDHEDDYVQDIFKNLDGQDIVGTSTKNTFSDRLIKNLNTRTLTDEGGKVLMLYSFLDRETLVIAQDENALYRAYVSYNTPRPK